MKCKYFITAGIMCIAVVSVIASVYNAGLYKSEKSAGNITLKTGDLIFQSNTASQGLAIQLATKSKFTHVGMIVVKQGKYFVYEAVGPVKLTPFTTFITHGEGNHYTVRRLKADSVLNDSIQNLLISKANTYKGKPYDIWFGWSDDYIYCSELVWKIYKQATGIDIGTLQKLKDFDLSSPVVQAIIAERYGTNIPYDETVISPDAMFNSPLLETVLEK